MRSFKQYITEIGDSSYPHFKVTPENSTSHYHSYKIKHPTEENKDINVVIRHDSETLDGPLNNAEVTFSRVKGFNRGQRYAQTNDMTPSESSKVFGAIHNIMKEHAAKNPHIKTYGFSSVKDENGGREKLYKTITKKMGGTSKDLGSETMHLITRKNLIGEE